MTRDELDDRVEAMHDEATGILSDVGYTQEQRQRAYEFVASPPQVQRVRAAEAKEREEVAA